MAKVRLEDVLINLVKFESPQYLDYIYAEVDEALASRISKLFAEKVSIREAEGVIKEVQSLLADCRFSLSNRASESQTQQSSSGRCQEQSGEQANSLLDSPGVVGHTFEIEAALSKGQNTEEDNHFLESASRECTRSLHMRQIRGIIRTNDAIVL